MSTPKKADREPNWWRKRRARTKRRVAAMSRRRRIWRRVGLLSTWFLALFAVIMVVAVVAFYQLTNVPGPQDIPQKQVATIEYSDGSMMARIGTQDRTIVPLSKVADTVKWAVLAAEDRNFYSEPGVSIKGTLRAFASDITGGDTQGGSGITQQYVKNAYLSSAPTLTRKIKELAIAVKLSREYSKDDILDYYLNTVYFGRGAYGIEAAAEVFFTTTAANLTTTQAALLAGMLRAPTYYDPTNNPTESKLRWDYVLDGMVSTKHLTATQRAAEVFPTTQPIVENNGLGASGPTAFIVTKVLAELQADGISEAEIYDRGLIIKTTIDKNAQADAVNAITSTFTGLTAKQQNMKNALVAVNPADGAVLAYYGGPNGPGYDGTNQYLDYAGTGCRPPGSSFKPYTLATALTQTLAGKQPGYTINTLFNGSQSVVIDGTTIHNDPSDASVSGVKTLAYAMKVSLNTTFDGLAYAVGPSDVAATAHAAGVTVGTGCSDLKNSDGTTSFGIGIGDYDVHPIDQAVGYASFADNGVAHPAYFVDSVTDSSGSAVYSHKVTGTQAMDARVANDVTLTMEPIAGYSEVPLAGGRVSASKTGTEGIEAGSGVAASAVGQNSDAWMVGFTPQVSAAVWVGSGNSVTPIYAANGGEEYGRDLPGKAWQAFMNAYLASAPKLPMATKQEVTAPKGSTATESPTATPTPSTVAPTPTPSTSAPTPTPTTPTPTPPSSTPVIPTTVVPTTPSTKCTTVLPVC